MTVIHLDEFLDYNKSLIQDFLKLETTGRYKIIITSVFDGPVYKTQYYMLYIIIAYTGHLLSIASRKFSYDVPGCYENRPFCFRIYSRNHDELASVLYEICQLLFGNPEKHNQFIQNARMHFQNAAGLEFCAGAAGYFHEPLKMSLKTTQKTTRRKK